MMLRQQQSEIFPMSGVRGKYDNIYRQTSETTWQTEVVKSILVNEKYTGDALLQKTYITDCITKKSRKNNGELPMYLVKNHHEPIISRADFNRVQEEMARRGAKKAIAGGLCEHGASGRASPQT